MRKKWAATVSAIAKAWEYERRKERDACNFRCHPSGAIPAFEQAIHGALRLGLRGVSHPSPTPSCPISSQHSTRLRDLLLLIVYEPLRGGAPIFRASPCRTMQEQGTVGLLETVAKYCVPPHPPTPCRALASCCSCNRKPVCPTRTTRVCFRRQTTPLKTSAVRSPVANSSFPFLTQGPTRNLFQDGEKRGCRL